MESDHTTTADKYVQCKLNQTTITGNKWDKERLITSDGAEAEEEEESVNVTKSSRPIRLQYANILAVPLPIEVVTESAPIVFPLRSESEEGEGTRLDLKFRKAVDTRFRLG